VRGKCFSEDEMERNGAVGAEECANRRNV